MFRNGNWEHTGRKWRPGFVVDSNGAEQPAILVGQCHQDIHVVDGEEARVAMQHPLVPVFINLIGQGDDISFLEA